MTEPRQCLVQQMHLLVQLKVIRREANPKRHVKSAQNALRRLKLLLNIDRDDRVILLAREVALCKCSNERIDKVLGHVGLQVLDPEQKRV